MNGGILMLLTLFFTLLYACIMGGMERDAGARVEALAEQGAAVMEDRLTGASEYLHFLVSLQHQSEDFERLFLTVSGTAENVSLQSHVALLMEGQGLMYFDEEGGMIVPALNAAYSQWVAALAVASQTPALKGPLPPVKPGGQWMLLLTRELDDDGRRRGAVAICVSLETLARRLYAVHALSTGGRRFFLVNERGEVLLPAGGRKPLRKADEEPMLQSLPAGPLSGNESVVLHAFKGEEYVAAKAPVGDTGWELLLFSPVRHELPQQSLLLWAFGGAWFCLGIFTVVLLHQARRQGHYKVLSEIDHLTGAGNRMAFEKHLERVGAQGRFPVCLIVMDVDGLKIINDRLGHQAGDALLRRVTLVLQRSLRENDAIYRLGGDEFAVIIPGAIYSVAQPLTERINVQAALMREKAGLPPIYISYGLAESRDLESFATLFKRADAAMYANKKSRHEAVKKAILQWVDEHPGHADRRGGKG